MKKAGTKNNYRRWLPALALGAGCLLGSMPARAGLIVSVQSVSAMAGSTGNSLDVLVQNSGPNVVVGGFDFQITAGSSVINFTQANVSTVLDPYIYAGNSLFGPLISAAPGQTLSASDFPNLGAGTTMHNGDVFGIGHVLFNVSGAAPLGPINVTIGRASNQTDFSDAAGAPLSISQFVDGTITVAASSPEPATWGLMGTVLLGFGAFRARRRSR